MTRTPCTEVDWWARDSTTDRWTDCLQPLRPIVALRFLVHAAATVRSSEAMGSKVIMVNDVARAFFEAPAIRNVCIEIPKEDLTEADMRHDKVGHLRMSVYGTRDAAMDWQEEVAKEMVRIGFTLSLIHI